MVLVQLWDAADPETGERYPAKRYKSEKVGSDDGSKPGTSSASRPWGTRRGS